MYVKNIFARIQPLLAQWRQIRTNWIVATADKFVLLFTAISVVMLIARWTTLPPAVPLWYSRPWGEEQLAHPAWLVLLPASGLAWHAITILLAATLTKDHALFGRVLFLGSFLTNFLLTITLVNIISLVT